MCSSCLVKNRELAKLQRKIWIIQGVSRMKNELVNFDAAAN
jgi:hypothetical protein